MTRWMMRGCPRVPQPAILHRKSCGETSGPQRCSLPGFPTLHKRWLTTSPSLSQPGFKQQLWKTVRFALFVFLVISGLSAVFDDRGISSKLMMSTNLHMAESSDKRFSDVMGVRRGLQSRRLGLP